MSQPNQTQSVTRKTAWGRIGYAFGSVIISVFLTYKFSAYLNNTAEIITVIAAIFSILAGVLIAVVSILGDPSMLMDQSWRHTYLSAKEIQRKLQRNIDIFALYIAILATLFVFAMLEDRSTGFYRFVQATLFFLTTAGFFASLSLPMALVKIQRDRLDAAIKSAQRGPKS
jgi:hypothetical protein